MGYPFSIPSFTYRYLPAPQPDTPVLLLLHGTGGNEDDLIPLGQSLCPGAAILSPRGQVLEGQAPRFFRRVAEGILDWEDWSVRAHELAGFVRSSSKDYGFAGRPVVAVGFSNGANIATGLLLQTPDVLAGAILIRPMSVPAPVPPPSLATRAVLISAGRRDPIVSADDPNRLAALLQGCGAAVEVHWEEGGHGLSRGDFISASSWLGRQTFAPAAALPLGRRPK